MPTSSTTAAETLEEGGPLNSGITETLGPSGTDTFEDDLIDETGNPQAGDLANSAFLMRPPPDGPGVRCSAIDTFSYVAGSRPNKC